VRVNIANLRRTKGDVGNFKFSEEFPSMGTGIDQIGFQTPVNVQFEITNIGKSLLVKGKMDTKLCVPCSLCLKEFIYPLNIGFEDEWVSEEQADEEQRDTALVYSEDEFEIDERIIGQIYLHLPMKFVCAEDCKGLCSKCGADLNTTVCGCNDEDIDPRLSILQGWNKGV